MSTDTSRSVNHALNEFAEAKEDALRQRCYQIALAYAQEVAAREDRFQEHWSGHIAAALKIADRIRQGQ